MTQLLSKLLMAIGLFCIVIAVYFIWERTSSTRLAFASVENVQKQNTSNEYLPTKITIRDLEIDLPIYPAKYDGGKWEATTNGVSYLISSPIPGQRGNSILYGHNWSNLLGNLPQIQPGVEIEIEFADFSKKTFVVEYTIEVTPKHVDVLKESNDERITLYTCSGFLDTKRFVVTALLKK